MFESSVDFRCDPYLPTIHFVHDDSPSFNVKCPCRQLVHTTAPDSDTVPLLHGSHTELFFAPSTSLLDPGAHAVQVVGEVAETAEE